MKTGDRQFHTQRLNLALVGACAFLAAACSGEGYEYGEYSSVEDGIIIGTNDLIPVRLDGSNVPSRYRGLLDGFGRAYYNGALCSATHVGNGLVVSAGHCFGAGAGRVNNLSCSGGYVEWGRREGFRGTRTDCQEILAMQDGNGVDYAIYRVSPVPPVTIPVQLNPDHRLGMPLTIFSHPGGRPLEWSQTCSVYSEGSTEIRYQCDTQGGSSGASVLRDDTLQIVALHWGGGGSSNIATKLSSTPLAEYMGGNPGGGNGGDIVVLHSGKCLDVAAGGTANGTNIQQWHCNGTGAQMFRFESLGNNTFRIVNPQSNKCVDISGSSTQVGANVQLWNCNGSAAQSFRLQDVGGGFARIINTNSNLCFDVSGGSANDGANVHQWNCHDGTNQHWGISDAAMGCSGVTLYQHTNYGGYAVTLPPGDYTLGALLSRGVLNDDVSSLRVPAGCSTTLYEHDNFGGATLVRSSDDSDLRNAGWNDHLSSVRVR